MNVPAHDSAKSLFDLDDYASTMEPMRAHAGWSNHDSPREAFKAIFQEHSTQDARFGLVFVSARYDLDDVAQVIQAQFQCPVLACTTAGEITDSHGYQKHGIAAAALFGVEATLVSIPDVAHFTDALAQEALHGQIKPHFTAENTIGMLVVDGLSMAEERVVAHLNRAMEGLPLIGGSAGDDLQFKRTCVYDGEKFVEGAAALALVHNPAGIRTFVHEHFEPTSYRGVITSAEPHQRLIQEINGWPAADEYAKAIGTDRAGLTDSVMGAHPMMIKTASGHFVRSVRRVLEDGSLAMYCAIEEGVIIGVGTSRPMVEDARSLVDAGCWGQSHLVIGYDCILRRIEAESQGVEENLGRALSQCPFIGFSTYGEQYMGLHINQTLAGAAFLGGAA